MGARDTIARLRATFATPLQETCDHGLPRGAKCLHCEAEADQRACELEREKHDAGAKSGVVSLIDLGPPVPAPAVVGSDTSRAAANEMSRACVTADERVVFRAIFEAAELGKTDDELEVETGLIHQTVSARRNGLVQKHKVRDSGQRRRTRSGRLATVWVVGEGIPVHGAPNHRALARPDAAELRVAAAVLTGRSDELDRVRAWLLALAEQ